MENNEPIMRHNIAIWQVDVDELNNALNPQDVLDHIKSTDPESVKQAIHQLDTDELDAFEDFGLGSYWLFELCCTFTFTYSANTIIVQLLK